MVLDLRTILVTVTVAAIFCTAARFVLWMLHPGLPGLNRWAWAGALGSVSLALITARGAIPDLMSQSVALFLLVLGMVLAWDGFRRFAGRSGAPIWSLAAFAGASILAIIISVITDRLPIQTSANMALLALTSALAARELLRSGPRGSRTAMRATGWLMCVNGTLFCVRAIVIAGGGAVPSGPTQNVTLNQITLLWWLGATIALTLGMVLMTSERLQSDLNQQASRDPLTGALNRRAFDLLAEREQARSLRNGQPMAIVMMDLDHFKNINDQLGHAGGDAVLRLFVEVLGKVLRAGDVFCRFGGEEFLALLPGSAASQAFAVAERLRVTYARDAAATTDPQKALSIAFTVSLGISQVQTDETLGSAIRRADAALYRAKAAGRNRCELAA